MSSNHDQPGRSRAGERRWVRRRELLGLAAGAAGLASIPSSSAGVAAVDGPPEALVGPQETGFAAGRTDVVTIEGAIRTPPVAAGDHVVIGTTRGVFVIQDGSVETALPVGPVRHLEALSPSAVVVLVETTLFANVVLVDPSTGELYWAGQTRRTIFNRDRGHEERIAGAFRAAAIDDEPTPDVAVALAYGITAFDGEDGEAVWSVDYPFYVWDVAVIDGTVFAATQDGRVLALDGSTGEERFTIDCVGAIFGTPRSVWDVEPVDGGDGLLVTGEDGIVRRLDATDGSVVWETTLVEQEADELEQYFRRLRGQPTMAGSLDQPADGRFRNLELVAVLDDGSCLVWLHDEEGPVRRDQELELVRLGSDGDIEWRSTEEALGNAANVVYAPDIDPEVVFLPQPTDHDTQTVVRLDLEDGSSRSPLEIDVDLPSGRRRGGHSGPGRLGFGGAADSLVVAGATGPIRAVAADGTVDWTVPRIANPSVIRDRFTGGDSPDYLLVSQHELDRDGSVASDALVLRSGDDGSVVWSRFVDPDDIVTEGLYQMPEPIARGEAGTDLAVVQAPLPTDDDNEVRQLQQQVQGITDQIGHLEEQIEQLEEDESDHEEQIEQLEDDIALLEADRDELLDEIADLGGDMATAVVHIDGRDGSVVGRFELRHQETDLPLDVRSFTVLGGTNMVLVDGQYVMQVLDLDDGTVRLEQDLRETDSWPPIEMSGQPTDYHAVDGPGTVDDLIAVGSYGLEVGRVETSLEGDGVAFEAGESITLEGQHILPGSFQRVRDLTGDGREEVLLTVQREDKPTTVVIQLDPLQVIAEFSSEPMMAPVVEETEDPITGEPGLLVYTAATEESLQITWFEDGSTRFEESIPVDGRIYSGERRFTPAAPIGDPDGDGSAELAVATSAADGHGLQVVRYDVESGQETERFILEPFRRSDPVDAHHVLAFDVDRMPHPADDDRTLIAMVNDPGLRGDPRFHLLDAATGDLVASTTTDSGGRTVSIGADGAIGVLSGDGSFTQVDVDPGVDLEPITDGGTIELSWTVPDDQPRVARVYVNDELSEVTADSEAAVDMPAGEYDVRVESADRHGRVMYASETATVDASSVMDLVLYGVATLSVAAVFAVGLADEVRRRVRS